MQTAPTFVRWMWIWITIGALVVVVVIGFLLGIVSSLEDIDDGLFEADTAVTGAGRDVDPLPSYIQRINGNLVRIDKDLKPISGQADDILGALRQINGSLVSVDSSLKDTSGSLVDTSGSLVDTNNKLGTITSLLVDTAGTLRGISGSLVDTTGRLGSINGSLIEVSRNLVSVRTLADRIDVTLKRAQVVRSLGTNAIWRRVRFLNGGRFGGGQDTSLRGPGNNPNGLSPVKVDADNILGGLRQINTHLTSICQSPTLQNATLGALGLVRPGPC